MGESKRRKERMKAAGLSCIFCGGCKPGPTEDHVPPKALFKSKVAPEGYVFPSCEDCNGGTSDDDLLISFIAHLDPDADATKLSKGKGLMAAVHRQVPGTLNKMFDHFAADGGIVHITDEMKKAVRVQAAKLTKAIYYRQTGNIFPNDGGIMFTWFTNEQLMANGVIPALEALKQIASVPQIIERNKQDLSDQFDYRYSVDANGALHVIQVVFGKVFGFVSIFSQVPGRIEALHENVEASSEKAKSPFTFLSSKNASQEPMK